MRSFLATLVGLVLAVGGVTCAPAASRVAVAAPRPSSVVAPALPVRGEPFTVSGRLASRVVRPVCLEHLVGAKWSLVLTGKTSRSGRYSLTTSAAEPVSKWRVVAPRARVGKKTYSRTVSRTRTVRTLSVTPPVPMAHERFTVSDRLPSRHTVVRPVVLQREVGKKWKTLVSGKTDASGVFTLVVPGITAASTEMRVVAKKIRLRGKTYSKVSTKITRVRTTAQSRTIALPAKGNLGSPVLVALTFTPGRLGRPVSLESWSDGRWQPVGAAITNAGGRASIATVPAMVGTHAYRGVAAAWNGASASTTQIALLSVAAPLNESRPIVQPVVLPTLVVGESFSTMVTVAGGEQPYSWSAVGLPAGVRLDARTGELSGTPSNAGSYPVTITVEDSGHNKASTDLGVVVHGAVRIATGSLPPAIAGDDYSLALTAADGTAPYTWSQTGLPNGVSLGSDGVLTGVPSAAGKASVSVTVTDAHGKTDTRSFALTVAPAIAITTSAVPEPEVGSAYTTTLVAEGGSKPYTWALGGGFVAPTGLPAGPHSGLPDGLELDSVTGVISGTPTAAGTWATTVTVTDDHERTATAELSIVVVRALSVATTQLPGAIAHDAYSATLVATGGRTPYRWAATGLPDGLSLDPDTAELSGSPDAAGQASVTVTVTDDSGRTGTRVLTLEVAPAVSIATTGLPDGVDGQAYMVDLAGAGGTRPYTWTADGLPTGLFLDASAGMIAGAPTAASSSSVTLTVTDAHGRTDTRVVTLVVVEPLAIFTNSLPRGVIGGTYLATPLVGTGGSLPYTWTATNLPRGLSLDAGSGVISGVPTRLGDDNVGITLTDARGRTTTAVLWIRIGTEE